MEAFRLDKHICTLLTIYPVAKHTRKLKYLHYFHAVVIGSANSSALTVSICFSIVFNLKTDIDRCLYALFQVVCVFSSSYSMWINALILRNTIAEIIRKYKTHHQVGYPCFCGEI